MKLSQPSQAAAFGIKARLNTLDELIAEFDAFYRVLGRVLPEINLEIYKTYKKASATLESLTSLSQPGKIDRMIAAMAEHLNSAVWHVDHLQAQDQRIHRVLSEFSVEFECMAQNWCHHQPNAEPSNAAPLLSNFMDLRHLHGSVLEPLGQIIAAEASLARDLGSYIGAELRSLENTLTSITLILLDLINRSDSTKQPILRIMTSLQIHDIICQDLMTLRRSLAEIERLGTLEHLSGPDRHFIDESLPLINSLLIQIAAIFSHETEKLREEADLIMRIISNEREDKILLSDFLLEGNQTKSTFDSILDDISDMLANVLSKLELLAARRWLLPGQLASLLNLAEMLLVMLDRYAAQFSEQTPGIEQVKQTLTEMINIKSDIDFYRLEELKAFVAEMESALSHSVSEMHEIRSLMLDSIAGIDSYSSRTISYLKEFSDNLSLDRHLIDGFKLLTQTPDRQAASPAATSSEAACPLHQELLSRLHHPHLDSLLRSESDQEDGLTVF